MMEMSWVGIVGFFKTDPRPDPRPEARPERGRVSIQQRRIRCGFLNLTPRLDNPCYAGWHAQI